MSIGENTKGNRNTESFDNVRRRWLQITLNQIEVEEREKKQKLNPNISDDTKARQAVIKEIEDRIANGEDLEIIAEEIASRPEIKKQFSYFFRNDMKTSLSTIFKNWYLSKQKNRYKQESKER